MLRLHASDCITIFGSLYSMIEHRLDVQCVWGGGGVGGGILQTTLPQRMFTNIIFFYCWLMIPIDLDISVSILHLAETSAQEIRTALIYFNIVIIIISV